MADMHKFVHIIIPSGRSTWEYRVNKGGSLSLTFVGYSGFDATITVKLVGAGAAATITGILIGTGDAQQSLHTMQIHKAPATTSNLLVKTVLSGHAKCLYDGGIRVEKTSQKTDAYQRNENLLLSDYAYSESKPSLEILADDVRCTHGAASGPIDPDEVWYLATRGISKTQSEHLIASGFIRNALTRVVDRDAKRSIISLWQSTLK